MKWASEERKKQKLSSKFVVFNKLKGTDMDFANHSDYTLKNRNEKRRPLLLLRKF